ncbi:MAG: heavy metal-binding domain-containing protein [Bacteroidota bacterium]
MQINGENVIARFDGGTTGKETVVYTCSMHPEIQSDKPGKCPKCGMKLIEKK